MGPLMQVTYYKRRLLSKHNKKLYQRCYSKGNKYPLCDTFGTV